MRRRRFAFRGTWGGRRMEGGLFRMGAFRCQCLFHLLSYSKQFDSASWCAQADHCVPAGQGLMNLFPGGRGSGDDEFFRDQLGTCIGNDVLQDFFEVIAILGIAWREDCARRRFRPSFFRFC